LPVLPADLTVLVGMRTDEAGRYDQAPRSELLRSCATRGSHQRNASGWQCPPSAVRRLSIDILSSADLKSNSAASFDPRISFERRRFLTRSA